MTVYARYDGSSAPDYITPGKLYKVEKDDGVMFHTILDEGEAFITYWEGSAHLDGDNWTRLESHPAAAILREIADEAAVNPEPHLAFEHRCSTSSYDSEQEWHTPTGIDDLIDTACRDSWQVRRKPKMVRAEGEVPQSAIDSARFLSLHGGGGHGESQIVARALLALVEGE